MLLLLIGIFLTICSGLAVLVVMTANKSKSEARLMEVALLGGARDQQQLPAEGGVLTIFTRLTGPVRDLMAGKNDDTAQRLSEAGFRQSRHADLFFAAKLLLPATAILAAAFLIASPVFAMLIVGALGFYLPDIWLTRAINKRRGQVRIGLPDAIDLLVICMEAGLGIDQALVRVGQELKVSYPALSEELITINQEQRAGKARVDAWRSMAERTQLDNVHHFVSMLVQTERFGTPIARSLGQFADSLRLRRMQKAEELAAKTTVKMIFPLVTCIFPALFLVLLGPAVMSISRGLGHLGK